MSTPNLPTCTSFTSRHFQLYQLADGVFAAINNPDGWAICNAGIIDLGDRTLVYDTFTAPQAADDLRDAAETVTGRPATLVVNSHYHNDHIWGNQAFGPQVDIIATEKTRHLILTEGASEIKWYRQTAQKRLETLEDQFAKSRDEEERRRLIPAIADCKAVVVALPILQVRLPTLAFTQEMVFYGPRRSARLMAYDNAHCGNDAILYLPEDHIAFMEDILFIGIHPYLADGNPEVVQRILGDVKALQPSIVVPGHGPLGGIGHLDLLDSYINRLKSMVNDELPDNLSDEELAKIPVPQEYQQLYFPIFFTYNLKFLYAQKALAAKEPPDLTM